MLGFLGNAFKDCYNPRVEQQEIIIPEGQLRRERELDSQFEIFPQPAPVSPPYHRENIQNVDPHQYLSSPSYIPIRDRQNLNTAAVRQVNESNKIEAQAQKAWKNDKTKQLLSVFKNASEYIVLNESNITDVIGDDIEKQAVLFCYVSGNQERILSHDSFLGLIKAELDTRCEKRKDLSYSDRRQFIGNTLVNFSFNCPQTREVIELSKVRPRLALFEPEDKKSGGTPSTSVGSPQSIDSPSETPIPADPIKEPDWLNNILDFMRDPFSPAPPDDLEEVIVQLKDQEKYSQNAKEPSWIENTWGSVKEACSSALKACFYREGK